MKKYLAVFVCFVLLSLFVAVPAFAQTEANNKSLWNKIMGLFSQTDSSEQTAATVKSQKNITTTPFFDIGTTPITPVDASPNENGCGQTLTPLGTINQTIRCNGRSWVADSNLTNNGDLIRIATGGAPILNAEAKLTVTTDGSHADNAIQGYSYTGNGVFGWSTASESVGVIGKTSGYSSVGVLGKTSGHSGVGVMGESFSDSGVGVIGKALNGATAVKAITGNFETYGFYQEGTNARNYMQGWLRLSDNPTENYTNSRLVVGVDSNSGVLLNGIDAFSRNGMAIRAESESHENPAIRGINILNAGVQGIGSTGVVGQGNNDDGIGTYGSANNVNAVGTMGESQNGTAILGFSSGAGVAVKAEKLSGSSGYGVYQAGTSVKNNLEGTLSVGYVNPGNLAIGVSVQVPAGVRIFPNTGVSRPACSNASNTRGTFWVNLGEVGAADAVQVCLRAANGTYSWTNL